MGICEDFGFNQLSGVDYINMLKIALDKKSPYDTIKYLNMALGHFHEKFIETSYGEITNWIYSERKKNEQKLEKEKE